MLYSYWLLDTFFLGRKIYMGSHIALISKYFGKQESGTKRVR